MIKNAISDILNIILGISYIKKRCSSNTVYYLPATGFGEIKSVLALIKMLKAKNENIEWKILIQDRRHEICDLMIDYNKYIELINATEYYRLTRLIIILMDTVFI